MGWLRTLLAKREAAKLALELAEMLIEEAEELAEFHRRAGRPARAGDLEGKIEKLRSLKRRRG